MFAGPLLAFAALGVLAMTLRWAFGEQSPWRPDPEPDYWQTPEHRDYGLLEEVAVVDGPGEADALRDALAAVNIRTTVVIEGDGKVRVLVFNDELEHARRVLG